MVDLNYSVLLARKGTEVSVTQAMFEEEAKVERVREMLLEIDIYGLQSIRPVSCPTVLSRKLFPIQVGRFTIVFQWYWVPSCTYQVRIDHLPVHCIMMWSGNPNTLPSGWALCNGSGTYTDFMGNTQSIPDLRGRFIVGYNASDTDYNSIGDNGGAKQITLTTNEIPSHNHAAGSLGNSTNGAHTHTVEFVQGNGIGSRNRLAEVDNDGNHTKTTSSNGSHSHTISGNTANRGGGNPHENRPPYYTLAYIIRVN